MKGWTGRIGKERRGEGSRARVTAVLVGVSLLAMACDDGITVPGDEPAQDGIVVGLNAAPFGGGPEGDTLTPIDWNIPDSLETVWVNDSIGSPCGVLWTVGPATDLLVQEGSALRRAVPADFLPLRDVRVWTDGPVADSCPQQGTATTILLD